MHTIYDRLLEDYTSLGTREASGCLTWNHSCVSKDASNDFKGYGSISVGRRRAVVTRVIYHHFVDNTFPIFTENRNDDIDHLCRQTNCYEPSHLELKSHRLNILVGKRSILRHSKTSAYAGVTYRKDRGTWMARAMLNGKKTHLGNFANEQDAAQAYLNAIGVL